MALLTVQEIDRDGITVTTVTPTASTGDTFVAADDGRHFILIDNGSGASINVTVAKQVSTARQDGAGAVAVADIVAAVAAGAKALIPVLPAFIRTNDGIVQVTCSSVTTVEIAAVKLPRLA